jgi:hypothetical protein
VEGIDLPGATALPGDDDEKLEKAMVQAEDLCRRDRARPFRSLDVEHPGGFRLRIKHSSVDHPEAGFGVHVEGLARAGTILAFYPGMIYFPLDPFASQRALWEKAVRDNGYMISRYDGTIIDGRRWHLKAANLRARTEQLRRAGVAVDTFSPPAGVRRFRNQFAIGNFVNHPPPGKQANVLQYSYNLRSDVIDEELQPFLPHEYQRPPGLADLLEPSVLFPSMLLVAHRNLRDEELFLNYRFNPRNPYPDWYVQPDPQEAARRWARWRWFDISLS